MDLEEKKERDVLAFQEEGPEGLEDDDPDSQCGICSFRPAGLQVCARIGAFIGVYSVSGLLTSTLIVYINSQVNMLEKQFGFNSSETGLLMSCNDIGFLSCVIITGYIAKKVHIPRGLGVSTILFGICGIVCALPYFMQDKSLYDLDREATLNSSLVQASRRSGLNICPTWDQDPGCKTDGGKASEFAIGQLWIKKVAYALLAIGMVLQGVGKSPRLSFLTLYVDDAVDKQKTGFYFGIMSCIGIVGPVLAYLLGGLFSKIYVTLEDVDITPKDPRWIGAWWLGFLIFGGSSLVFAVPLMCFPAHLRKRKLRQVAEKNEVKHKSTTNIVWRELKHFLQSVVRVLRNPVNVLSLFTYCFWVLSLLGMLAFMPKYLSTQYSLPLWKSNIMIAFGTIGAFSIGAFVSGIITRRFEMTPRRTMIMLTVLYIIEMFFVSSGFYLGCDQPEIVGGSDKGSDLNPLYKRLDSNCTAGCGCSDNAYFPICGGDGLSYFSPCHAGCRQQAGITFSNCTCIAGGMATGGLCEQDCDWRLYTYIGFTFIASFAAALRFVPVYLTKIRCVQERDRSVGVAVAAFASCALGNIPAPVVTGRIVDSTCLLWKYTCGERQSCLLYDGAYFRTALHVFALATKALGLLMVVIMLWLVRDGRDWASLRKYQVVEDQKHENENGHSIN